MCKGKKLFKYGCWALLAAVLVVLLVAAFDTRLVTRTYPIDAPVETTVRLAVLTDLHSCDYGEGQEDLLQAVAELEPDGVLLVGDIVDDVLPEENAFLVLEALAREYPCAYVTGNHEYWTGRVDELCEEIAALGIDVLRGDQVTWTLQGQKITLYGVDDADSGKLEEQLAAFAPTEGEVSILLAHRPEKIDRYAACGFTLVVSGHAHGGQWRLPGLINGLYAPHQGWFPEYAGGLYQVGDTAFVVSRGLARESTRVPRIFNPPELVLLELTAEG